MHYISDAYDKTCMYDIHATYAYVHIYIYILMTYVKEKAYLTYMTCVTYTNYAIYDIHDI